MTEETKTTTPAEKTPKPPAAKKEKPQAIEDKPFMEFIQEHFNPTLKSALEAKGINDLVLNFQKTKISIKGLPENEEYWQLIGDWNKGDRHFNIYFIDEDIKGQKAFSCATNLTKSSTLESFMIDERKVTLDLMLLYTLQRLNGQKWLTRN